ncbi:MAG TPA: M24 family metallopeptidase [Vicinamibacterales bacterium]
MPLDVAAVQAALREEGLDGWLLYDFRNANPIAARLAGLAGSGVMATRRWYYLIPRDGSPKKLVHAIERHNLDALPGETTVYAGRAALDAGLTALLDGHRRVAMEYSPECAIPYLSRVDAGTLEQIRKRGVDVVSSGDLVQRFEAVWDEAALASHREASARLYRIKDRAFEWVRGALAAGRAITELDVQQEMQRAFEAEGLVSDSLPVVAAQENAGNPHYLPTRESHRPIGRDEVLLLDLWGKLRTPGAVYADITWMGFTGQTVPDRVQRAWTAAATARDAAIACVREGIRAGRDVRGWQVDRAARQVLIDAGFGDHILHRTGHSLGEEVHGNGVHMDDYETHDDRRLIPGTGFTIEPGVYFEDFGIRTEVNVTVGHDDATVTGESQTAIVTLA